MSDEATKQANESYIRPISTILICKSSLMCTGIKHLLSGFSFDIIGAVPDVAMLSDRYSDVEPDLFIVDGSNSAAQTVEALRHLKEKHPDVRVAVIADSYDLSFVQLGRSAGVDGFCLSASSREVLIKSLELVILGEVVLPAALMASLLNGDRANPKLEIQDSHTEATVRSEDPRARKLSAREAQILSHLMEGEANKVIARKLDVAEATIKVHIKAILRKIGAANRTQAAMWASTHLPAKDGSPLAA